MRPFWTSEEGEETLPEFGGRRTLIVEDDDDSREAMGEALRRFGYDADCAGTFLEGVAKLTPEVQWLILDLRLPDGDGATLLRYIRQHRLPVNVAVVTAAQEGALLGDAVLLRPDALFTKPVDYRDVARWMSTATPRPPGDVPAGPYAPMRRDGDQFAG